MSRPGLEATPQPHIRFGIHMSLFRQSLFRQSFFDMGVTLSMSLHHTKLYPRSVRVVNTQNMGVLKWTFNFVIIFVANKCAVCCIVVFVCLSVCLSVCFLIFAVGLFCLRDE